MSRQKLSVIGRNLVDRELQVGMNLSNEQLRRYFQCAPQGGMRKSNQKKALILISDETKELYKDYWDGDMFYYAGMGQKGDQSLAYAQNKTLYHSNESDITVHLFEVLEKKIYTYRGLVYLVDQPFQEYQKDKEGNDRAVWIFPLKLKKSLIEALPVIEPDQNPITKPKKKNRKGNNKIEEKNAHFRGKKVSNRYKIGMVYERDQDIVEYAKRRANGICELCRQTLDYCDEAGRPFLETHHIVWLNQGGEDTIENTAALCPNCHRRMHVLKKEDEVEFLLNLEKYISSSI